jgi:hypothetical protein
MFAEFGPSVSLNKPMQTDRSKLISVVGRHRSEHTMKVHNVHERTFPATELVGALIDSLASEEDALWPIESWPRMVFDRPLVAGAAGGHGPIRYFVEAYSPGESITFRFTGPTGFNGWHGYEIVPMGPEGVALRHTLEMTTSGLATLSWPLVFRPLHDALIEDSLARAQASLGHPPSVRPWSPWVKFLRGAVSRGRARQQVTPNKPMQRTAFGGR